MLEKTSLPLAFTQEFAFFNTLTCVSDSKTIKQKLLCSLNETKRFLETTKNEYNLKQTKRQIKVVIRLNLCFVVNR